jgi:hypothetical protein
MTITKFYNDLFISYCIDNKKHLVRDLMSKRPTDFRIFLKGIKICIGMKHNELAQWLYWRMGGKNKLGKTILDTFYNTAIKYRNIQMIIYFQNEKEYDYLNMFKN